MIKSYDLKALIDFKVLKENSQKNSQYMLIIEKLERIDNKKNHP